MGPQPIRGYSKKDSSALPHAKACQFLYRAAMDLAKVCPAYASYLGRRCIKKMEQGKQHHGMSNIQVAQLCRKCGCPLTVGKKEAVSLSRSTVRRSQRIKASSKASNGAKKQVMRGGIVKTCVVCQNRSTQKYPTMEMAEQKM